MTEEQNRFIGELYREAFAQLYVYANSALRNDALAEEAVQDTFRIACAKPEALCTSPNPRGWLLVTLKNVMKNMVRSQARANRLISAAEHGEVSTSDPVDLRVLYGRLADTDEFRLIRGIAEGRTIRDLAKERSISVEACKKRVQRARDFLQKKI